MMRRRPVNVFWMLCADSVVVGIPELDKASDEESRITLEEILITETRTPQPAHQLAGATTERT
jgi:hypothetical protein